MDRSMIDAASGGALMDKTPTIARNLISNMAGSTASEVVNEVVIVDNQILENKTIELTTLSLDHHISPLLRVCGICASMEHSTDACPTLQKIDPNNVEVAAMMGGQQYR
ncbi:hypothetical protein CR513_51707, partial [Mucuna pruriens]